MGSIVDNDLSTEDEKSNSGVVGRIVEDMDVDEDGIDDIVIVVKGNIYLISGARGVLLWQQELSENFQVQLIKVTSETSQNEKKLILVGNTIDGGNSLHMLLTIYLMVNILILK